MGIVVEPPYDHAEPINSPLTLRPIRDPSGAITSNEDAELSIELLCVTARFCGTSVNITENASP